MSPPAVQSPSSQRSLPDRCPACGQTLDQLVEGKCPLCEFQIRKPSSTSQDTTPYAQATSPGLRGWWAMCRWIFFSSNQRLSYLSLVRVSPAGRRYARTGLILFALAAMCVQMTHAGWQRELLRGPNPDGVAENSLRLGWIELGMTEPPGPGGQSFVVRWNPAITATTAIVTLLLALLMGWLWLRSVDWGIGVAMGGPAGRQERLGCALRYSTAWLVPVCVPALLILLRPLWYLAEVRGWTPVPPLLVLYLPLVIVAATGLILWWVWLIRLSLTVPLRVRTRVLLWFILATPTLGALLVGGGAYGLHRGFGLIWAALDMGSI